MASLHYCAIFFAAFFITCAGSPKKKFSHVAIAVYSMLKKAVVQIGKSNHPAIVILGRGKNRLFSAVCAATFIQKPYGGVDTNFNAVTTARCINEFRTTFDLEVKVPGGSGASALGLSRPHEFDHFANTARRTAYDVGVVKVELKEAPKGMVPLPIYRPTPPETGDVFVAQWRNSGVTEVKASIVPFDLCFPQYSGPSRHGFSGNSQICVKIIGQRKSILAGSPCYQKSDGENAYSLIGMFNNEALMPEHYIFVNALDVVTQIPAVLGELQQKMSRNALYTPVRTIKPANKRIGY